MKKYTAEQLQKKYKGKYIKVYGTFDYTKQKTFYEVRGVYDTIHEDTTRGEDVGTSFEYRR